ncbi:MAG: replication-associated recombination protein A, partial [Solirubrobacterales bacterium]|nr:replication-associated recombination protein A [Solirubrobacterales bacterium]
LVLIGATTENPYFEVNPPLLSRSTLFRLQPLGPEAVTQLLDKGLEAEGAEADDEALAHLAERAGGDARTALGALERAAETAAATGAGVDLGAAEDALQRKAVSFDKQGDRHYDYASALIKSLRGSDPDAALYYLAAMLEGGEDPRFIARRMVILASEDIGNADPQALLVATAAGQAVDRVGLPECALNLAQAAAYLALAPKSNASTTAISAAMRHVREHGAKLPPDHLRDAHYAGAKKLGRGEGYIYPHEQPGGIAEQPLLPDEVRGERFYEPVDRGFEAELRERLAKVRRRLGGD